MFTNHIECINYIETIKRFSKRTSLDRMKLALKLLNNPELNFKKVHVAGTNGKGSTTKFISSILREYDIKVGTFTSPYIKVFNERIQINDNYISNEELIKYTNLIYDLSVELEKNYDEHITFFEFLTLLCFKYFSDSNVEIAVIEVGLGGLLDATNACDYDLSVITSIGFDHMEQLGHTLEEICLNKLGIIKSKENHLIFHSSNLDNIFINYLNNINASYLKLNESDYELISTNEFIYENNKYLISMNGKHQIENALLAINVCKKLVNFDYNKFFNGLNKMYWPGRLEQIKTNPTVYLDGAHNIHGIDALTNFIKENYKDKNLVNIIFCAMKDKETDIMIKMLCEVSNNISVTEIDYPRCKKLNDYEEDFLTKITLEKLMDNLNNNNLETNKTYFITGSLYFVSYILNNLKR
jgi:dihydrofolate synthase/folylpolyglutamate synthase